MGHKSQDLGMAAACFFFLLLSLAGLLAVLLTGEVKGVDSLLMLMVCAGMALLFAWLTFSALHDAGLLGAPKPAENPGPALAATSAAPANPGSSVPPSGAEGKQSG